ncbi:hypothetical protein AWM70_07415 [Paenibacillus yonginensis]|uniref:CobN/magnesium chelatase domain-containing protein n=1 Tax=Paenibacillus yonginensis TaxID=1462996 RepID=A0A1B1MZ40_9BACL|nr:cobaltochelatase subunit CobN [Paenibacillus yonginensis]ANS74429.1 hypothetical protein AWM70_07415 [Paenibacillus yonginensis]
MKVVLFSASQSALRDLSTVYPRMREQEREALTLSVFNLEGSFDDDPLCSIQSAAEEADLILLDAHGSPAEKLQPVIGICKSVKAKLIPVGGNYRQMEGALSLGEMTPKEQESRQQIRAYWQGSGLQNLEHLLAYLLHQYSGRPDQWACPPVPVLLEGIQIMEAETGEQFETTGDYWKAAGAELSKPTVAVLFMGNSYPLDTRPVVSSIIRKIREQAGANVLPVGFASIAGIDVQKLRHYLSCGGADGSQVRLIVNFIPFRLGSGPTGGDSAQVMELLEELKVPLVHPFFLTRKQRSDWESSPQGLAPSEFMVQMMLPELDGAIDLLPVATMEPGGGDDEIGSHWKQLSVIGDRADRLVRRITRYLTLQSKPREDKKVAIIGYNYPPGEGNLFGGSFLDTFESLSRILSHLKKEGYQVEEMTGEEIRSKMLQEGLVNSAVWADGNSRSGLIPFPAKQYQHSRNPKRAQSMLQRWGPPPGEVMAEKEHFQIPGFINGHVFIGLQPTRGIHEDPSKSYHDKSQLPPHQYLAFYQYIREHFQADALLHIGTHGTLEFMEGKEAGMSQDCLPDELIGDLPHFYYYYMGNPSEAMIAKRRSHAVLISYQSPPFEEAELYGDFNKLDGLLHDYYQAQRLNPGQAEELVLQIREAAQSLHLNGDDLEEIEKELYRMRRSLIPHGLHILGDRNSRQHAADYMGFVLKHDRAEARSLVSLLAARKQWDYEQLVERNQLEALESLDKEAAAVTDLFARTGEIPFTRSGSPEWEQEWSKTWAFGKQAFELAQANRELEQLTHALDGKYVPAKLAGDVVRHPHILPSGYNLYQFDPRAVPSDTAVKRGERLAANTLALYKKEQGAFPSTIAVVMWGLETSRTQGETFGQILSYLGARIARRNALNQPVYEFIPVQELGRPRMNVVINICGFFRDMFPNLIEDLNQLFEQISTLEEDDTDNEFKKQTHRIYEQLVKDGMNPKAAWDLACARIFGPAEGEYGARVNKLVETRAWTEEADLGRSYMDSLKYVYSRQTRGQEAGDLFSMNLKAVDIVSQVRSNHEHEVTDLDHYYEYFGGLAKSVELSKGTRAEIYISDTTGQHVLTEDVQASIQRGLQTRILNPKWMDGLLEHSYHGVQKIAERFHNMLGLAATTSKVETWMFSALHETYVADEQRSRQMEENNRWAYHHMLETLLESHQRQYWEASEEELSRLYNRMMELEGELEGSEAEPV